MILDKEALFAYEIPFDQDSDYVDIITDNTDVGPYHNEGQGIQILVTGEGLSESSGEPTIEFEETADPDTSWAWAMRVLCGPATLADKGVIITLPTNIARFVRMRLVGFDGGVWTAGVVTQFQ